MTCHVAAILVRCIASQACCRVCNQHGRRCALDIIAAVGVPSAPSGDFATDSRSVSIGELCVGNQPAEPNNLDQPREEHCRNLCTHCDGARQTTSVLLSELPAHLPAMCCRCFWGEQDQQRDKIEKASPSYTAFAWLAAVNRCRARYEDVLVWAHNRWLGGGIAVAGAVSGDVAAVFLRSRSDRFGVAYENLSQDASV